MNIEDLMYQSEVFIQVNSKGYIMRCEGGYTIQTIEDFKDWIKIDEGRGDKYNLCQQHYFEKPLVSHAIHNYIYENGQVRETTDEEKAQERASFPEPELDDTTITQEMLVDQEYRLTLMELGI